MKVCPNCGANVQDNAMFCTNCGANIPAAAPAPAYNPSPAYNPAPVYNPVPPYKEPISVGGWIGRSLIPMIPIVGSIVYLIMLFIWSGDETKEETFRNWAKAQLIVMAIGVGLGIIFGVLFGIAMS